MKRGRLLCLAALVILVVGVGLNKDPSKINANPGVGEQVHQITVPVSGVDTFCSIGLAFDGDSLYYNRCGDPNIYRIDPVTGGLVDFGGDGGIFNSGINENPNALAFDAKRNGLWIGSQGCNAIGMPIYFWDFDDNSVTLQFTIPAGLINQATGNSFLRFCFVDGLAYNENDSSSDSDDEMWFSDDVNRNVGVFNPQGCPGPSPCGDLLAGYDGTTVDPSLAGTIDTTL